MLPLSPQGQLAKHRGELRRMFMGDYRTGVAGAILFSELEPTLSISVASDDDDSTGENSRAAFERHHT
jgi:hypothetical protein